MKIAEIIAYLESIAHPSLQEDYDNAGLITGAPGWECTGAIVSLDATEAVVAEAIEKKFNLVIAHHPIVFRGLKKINGNNYIERALIHAIKNDIAIYAIHTNLDNVQQGVSGMMAHKLGLINTSVLVPKPGQLSKMQVFVPVQHVEQVRAAMFEAGAGHIGNYSECSFNTPGTGTFKAGEGALPFAGAIGLQHREDEIKIETIFPSWLQSRVVRAMQAAHPYEEVAYDVWTVSTVLSQTGAGIIGNLPEPMEEKDFLQQIRAVFHVPVVRHTELMGRPVNKVALCGGAGSFLISNAIHAGTDFYITSDIKYHEFFDANSQLVVADVGHYESEQFTIDLLSNLLRKKFPTFAALKTAVKTNPVNYFL